MLLVELLLLSHESGLDVSWISNWNRRHHLTCWILHRVVSLALSIRLLTKNIIHTNPTLSLNLLLGPFLMLLTHVHYGRSR